MGPGSYIADGAIRNDFQAEIQIGNYCSIATGVGVLIGGESQHLPAYNCQAVANYPIKGLTRPSPGRLILCHDVWVGQDVLFCAKGPILRVGNGAIIGARSVVTDHIEPYSIVAGSPARLIGRRFAPHVIDRLEQIAWWNWPQCLIEARAQVFLDINAFVERYYKLCT